MHLPFKSKPQNFLNKKKMFCFSYSLLVTISPPPHYLLCCVSPEKKNHYFCFLSVQVQQHTFNFSCPI